MGAGIVGSTVWVTFAHVSRNLDMKTLVDIASSRELPQAWKGNAHLELAHHLYWHEKDYESWEDHEAKLTCRCADGDFPV